MYEHFLALLLSGHGSEPADLRPRADKCPVWRPSSPVSLPILPTGLPTVTNYVVVKM